MKVFYFVLTTKLTWGKGVTLKAALEAAQVKPSDKKTKYIINIGVCKKDTPDDVVKNLLGCFGVTGLGGIEFYNDPNPANAQQIEADRAQAKEYFLGWAEDTGYSK